MLYTYIIINRHAGPPNITKTKVKQYIIYKVVIIVCDSIAIEAYNNIGAWVNI